MINGCYGDDDGDADGNEDRNDENNAASGSASYVPIQSRRPGLAEGCQETTETLLRPRCTMYLRSAL